jgi:hypothetical protein
MSDPGKEELLQKLHVREMEVEQLKQENLLLRQKIDALARRLFGVKSEQLDENQLLLLLQMSKEPDGPFEGKDPARRLLRLNLRGPAKPHRKNRGGVHRVCPRICR